MNRTADEQRARLWALVERAVAQGHRVTIRDEPTGWTRTPEISIGFDFFPDQDCDTPEFWDIELGTRFLLSEDFVPYYPPILESLEFRYGGAR